MMWVSSSGQSTWGHSITPRTFPEPSPENSRYCPIVYSVAPKTPAEICRCTLLLRGVMFQSVCQQVQGVLFYYIVGTGGNYNSDSHWNNLHSLQVKKYLPELSFFLPTLSLRGTRLHPQYTAGRMMHPLRHLDRQMCGLTLHR